MNICLQQMQAHGHIEQTGVFQGREKGEQWTKRLGRGDIN